MNLLRRRLLAGPTLLAASRALPPAAAAFSAPRMMAARETPSRLHAAAWRLGTEPLQWDPSALCSATDEAPRLARDEAYAAAVLDAWRDEAGRRTGASEEREGSVCMPFVYDCPADGSRLHGCVYRKSPPSSSGASHDTSLPGVVLFHTGAGPQDVFLRWKADSLVHARDAFGEEGCVVLIADILGDASGWAWHDRTRYDAVRTSLLVPDERGERTLLSGRAAAAVDALASQPGVDPNRLTAMGYCLGGHPILELARRRDARVQALATFHGVFDGVRHLRPVDEGDNGTAATGRVLVCTGADDPFVPPNDLDAAAAAFEGAGYRCDVRSFAGARHGFTNPGQASNPHQAFGYGKARGGGGRGRMTERGGARGASHRGCLVRGNAAKIDSSFFPSTLGRRGGRALACPQEGRIQFGLPTRTYRFLLWCKKCHAAERSSRGKWHRAGAICWG